MRYDWTAIQIRFEKGETPYQIAQSLGNKPTRQAIMKRAKKEGWTQIPKLPTVTNGNTVQLGKDTPENREFIIQKLEQGANLKVAAACTGISEDTLRRWRKADAGFAGRVDAAQAMFLTKQLGRIDEAGERDWKAAAWHVDRSKMGQEHYAPSKTDTGKVNVVFNILRGDVDETVVIEGETG